jgi:histidine triad (HIT) family protein
MSDYDPDNIFAKIIAGQIPKHTVYEDDSVLVFMDVMPQSQGHCLVVPKAGSRNLLDAEPETLSEVILTVQRVARAAKTALRADGVIVQQFNEAPAGQTVFHLHFHIVPVFEGEPLHRHADRMVEPDVLAEFARSIAGALR